VADIGNADGPTCSAVAARPDAGGTAGVNANMVLAIFLLLAAPYCG
jgi:hypothetical protein